MKMTITLEIDVNPGAWEESYGVGPELAHIREDVLAYVRGQVQGSAAGESGAIREVKLLREPVVVFRDALTALQAERPYIDAGIRKLINDLTEVDYASGEMRAPDGTVWSPRTGWPKLDPVTGKKVQ